MLSLEILTRDGQNKIWLVDAKKLQQGDDFLLLLDKFCQKSKISPVDLKKIRVLTGGQKLGITSQRIIRTAVAVLNTASRARRHFCS
ncbi:MAG: hypothetical protein COU85_01335 [Candidatus Portnoybacteria bacterium CG10_big_fil_rev_8_21_14_0_10_44_7]|uniref:Uncharacterized protein n=1 Tax=Candidatus Portnoybacteria bacterium CG10_big_fil_rev_8_21_14_0_10_44_7 TaxID=1974816 RepID=A0A2M8KIX0_9BACT|nr:MAG: hypothetical protein COU85_01335 [Candidatus Portnoybacteria bacterium CG10_big_fil_rev_8_21_14_0_10_44_7]